MVRHAGGAAKVAKTLLPSDMLKAYPIDEKAAAAEAEANAKGKAIYDAQAQALREQRAQEHAARLERNKPVAEAIEKAQAKMIIAKEEAAANTTERVLAAVKRRAEVYLKTEQRSNTSWKFDVQIDLDPPEEVPGWPNRYRVFGFGYYQLLEQKGGIGGDKSWFEATVQLSKAGGNFFVSEFKPLSGPPLNR